MIARHSSGAFAAFSVKSYNPACVQELFSSMRVNVNGRDEEVPARITVADLIGRYHLEPRQVAVEVNRDLVPRRSFHEKCLSEGDRIEIVTLVGGG